MEENHISNSNIIDVDERIIQSSEKSVRDKSSRSLFVACIVFFSLTLASLCTAIIYLDQKGIIPESIFTKIVAGAVVFLLLDLLMVYGSRKNKIIAVISVVICLLVIIGSAFGIYTMYKLYESMNAVEDPDVYYASIGIYVKKDSNRNNTADQ